MAKKYLLENFLLAKKNFRIKFPPIASNSFQKSKKKKNLIESFVISRKTNPFTCFCFNATENLATEITKEGKARRKK